MPAQSSIIFGIMINQMDLNSNVNINIRSRSVVLSIGPEQGEELYYNRNKMYPYNFNKPIFLQVILLLIVALKKPLLPLQEQIKSSKMMLQLHSM